MDANEGVKSTMQLNKKNPAHGGAKEHLTNFHLQGEREALTMHPHTRQCLR